MQCVILAGGLGTRMKAIAGGLPKALLPVGTQTFIDWQLQWLFKLGVTQAVLALGYQGEQIRSHVENQRTRGGYPAMFYRFDGPEYLGTGGAIRNCADLLEDDFVVTYGDAFLFVDVSKLFAKHRAAGRGVTMSIYKNRDTGDKSNVVFDGSEIRVYDKVSPNAQMDHIDYGLMAFRKDYFLKEAPAGKSDLATILHHASKAGQITPYLARRMFCEIGSPQGYANFIDLLAAHGFDLEALKSDVS